MATDSLYIRWSHTGSDDNRTDPGASPWCWSKSLQIINPNDATQDDGLALAEVEQFISVRVDTLLMTTNVAVQAWVCAYGTAGAPFLPSANDTDGLFRDVDDALNPFTANPVAPTEPFTNQLEVKLPWKPLNSDLPAIGAPAGADLHVCLLANVYSTAGVGDGAQIPGPGRPAINVATNRHHAQRNIKVHPAPSSGGMMLIGMFSGNPFEEGDGLFLIGAAGAVKPQLERDDLKRLQAGRWLREDGELPGRGGTLRLADDPLKDLKLAIAGETGQGDVKVRLAAGKPQPLEIEVDVPKAEPGTLHVLDVDHRDGDGELAVGGARVLVLSVDDERYEALQPKYEASV